MSPLVDAPRSKGGFALGDYVEVKDRIRMFYEAFPSGALVTGDVRISVDDDVPRVIVQAFAYRTPEDPHPAVGWSWLELPGKTPYTKGSELENAETSAWGRAIGALGIGIDRSIASKNEVDAKASGDAPGSHDLGRPPLERTTHENGLTGKLAVGPKGSQDFELRETPDGHAISFRLKEGNRAGQIVVAEDPIASALNAIRETVMGQTVTVWGYFSDESFDKPDGTTIYFKVLHAERVQTPDVTIPPQAEAETASLGLVDDDLSDLDFVGGERIRDE